MNYDLESIVIKIKADANGNLLVPLHGYNTNEAIDCPYNLKISVDDGAEVTYSGATNNIDLIVSSGLTVDSEHIVTIKPVVEDYQWARAFGTDGQPSYITEIIWDKTYMGFAISATDTGGYFRVCEYQGCSITSVPEEYMPDTVTTVGIYFRAYQYSQCTGLVSGTPEVLSNSIITIGDRFRAYQYGGDDSIAMNITDIPDEVMPDSVTTIGTYFRAGMYYRCVKIEKAAKEAFSTNVTSIGIYFRPYEYYGCISLTTASEEAFDCKVVNIPNYFRYRTYRTCESLKTPVKEVIPSTVTSIGTYYRAYQYANCINLITPTKEVLHNNITTIGDYFRAYQYCYCKSIKTPAEEHLPDSVTTIGDSYRSMMYSYSGITKTAVEYVPPHLTSVGGFYRDQQYLFCESLTEIVKEADIPGVSVGNGFRVSQYRSCPSITKAKLAAFTGTFLGNNRNLMFTDSLSTNTPVTITIIGHAFEKPQASLGITNDAVVDKIYVDSNFLQQYKSSSNWSAISDDKFVGISTASVTAGILVGYKKNITNVDKQLILAGSTLENNPRRVLTGTENWVWDAANNRVYMTITQDTTSWYGASSTHGPCKQSSSDTTRDDGRCTDNKKLCCYTTKNSLQEFKDWLAQEYADGTPVIVINFNGAFNTRPGTPQDINVMDGENIIEVMSTAASKPEDIKLEATVGLDTGTYISYVLNDNDYTTINNWIEISKVRPEQSIERGSIGGDITDQEDLQEILDSKADNSGVVHLTGEETITGKKNFTGGITVTSPTTSTDAATKGYVDNGLNTKQDTLTAGTGINITNNVISSTGGDISYSNFEFTQPTGNTITLTLSTEITPSANFTVNAPSEVKEGMAYILRVTNGATPVTMTLGTGIVNPSSVDLTLTANAIDQFSFLGLSDGTLELQPGGSGDSLPDQTGKAGKFLQTNGTSASWNDPNEFLTQAQYDALTPVNGITYFIYEVEN